MSEQQADLALAIDAARRAGAVVMRYFGRDLVVEHKTPDQPLTEADLAANAVLHEVLIGARPDYGWLSEETRDHPDRLARSRVWIVDPIDGTTSFIAELPEFAISVGLVHDGVPIVGVVYNPARDEMYHAARGAGAFISRGGATAEPVHVSGRRIDDRVTMLASRGEIAAGEFDPFRGGWRIEPAGSTAYKLAGVAAGAGEAFVSRGPKSEWDICAGVLLVSEAGGRATDLDGAALRFNREDPYVHGILATNGVVHDAVLTSIGEMPATARLRARPDPLHPGLNEESEAWES
ncbi:MAG TPA: 3'(2'),5'-bisphosphate nucleotidase CysQ [Longimicrobiales bacterium]|nr:3'(2'),5'-bisphosphate nucleotidase CysQ [Longimicrobiales bacterium]